ncbi:MAG: GGIII-like transmembrane region-containing protein, partial [Candidatus Hodarchaeota archaeon]
TASFILDIDSKAMGSYLFDLDIDWTQEDKEFEESLLVTIEVSQKQLGDSLSGENLYYAGGGLFLLFLFILILVIRRRRRKQR